MNLVRAGVLAVIAAAVVALAIPALAQPDDATDQPDKTSVIGDFAARLAEELGIGEQRVERALEQVHEDVRADFEAERLAALKARLDQAVEDGDLTRAQADAILEAHESGVLGGPGLHGFGGPRHHGAGDRGFHGHVLPAPEADSGTDEGQVERAPEPSDPQADDSTFVIPRGDATDL